jgi:threonine dehydrogenase-like Zn-dependent dehydrogenase
MAGGIGVDRAIDAVGVDADHAETGPAAKAAKVSMKEYKHQRQEIAPKTNPKNGNWQPGRAPSQVLEWAVEALAKAGTLSIIGVYPLELVRSGAINPSSILDAGGAARLGDRRVQGVRRAAGGLDQGGVVAGPDAGGGVTNGARIAGTAALYWSSSRCAPLLLTGRRCS